MSKRDVQTALSKSGRSSALQRSIKHQEKQGGRTLVWGLWTLIDGTRIYFLDGLVIEVERSEAKKRPVKPGTRKRPRRVD